MQVIVDSLVTNYQQIGKGPLVVLLHGWGDNLLTYQGLQSELSQKYTVVSLDLPGFGQTGAPTEIWNLDNYARFVTAFLDKNQLGPVYALVGHSNGAAVVIRGISLGVMRAEKLVLMGAAGIRPAASFKRSVFKIIAKVGKATTFWLPARRRKQLQTWLYGAAGSDLLVVPQLKDTFKVTVRQDVQADAAKIHVPTLLIYGQDDRATPVSNGKLFSQLIEGSQLEVIPAAGHFVFHDQAVQVATVIQEFLA